MWIWQMYYLIVQVTLTRTSSISDVPRWRQNAHTFLFFTLCPWILYQVMVYNFDMEISMLRGRLIDLNHPTKPNIMEVIFVVAKMFLIFQFPWELFRCCKIINLSPLNISTILAKPQNVSSCVASNKDDNNLGCHIANKDLLASASGRSLLQQRLSHKGLLEISLP
jgi:hypothetical protein